MRKYVTVTGLAEGYIKRHCPHQANEILEWKTGALERSLSGTEQLSELFNNLHDKANAHQGVQNPEE